MIKHDERADALPAISDASIERRTQAIHIRRRFIDACNAGIEAEGVTQKERLLIAECLWWYIQHTSARFWVTHGKRPPIDTPERIGFWWKEKRSWFSSLEEALFPDIEVTNFTVKCLIEGARANSASSS